MKLFVQLWIVSLLSILHAALSSSLRDSSSLLPVPYGYLSTAEPKKITGRTQFYMGGNNEASAPRDWSAIAGSEDLSKIVAATSNSLYVSVDFGKNWKRRGPTLSGFSTGFTDVTSSLDGQHMAATNDHIYLSSDYGQNWVKLDVQGKFVGIAVSGSGMEMVAVSGGVTQWARHEGNIFISVKGGENWSKVGPMEVFTAVTASSNFRNIAAATYQEGIYISSDSGLNWKKVMSGQNYISLASSYDGSVVAGATDGGYIFVSTNYGQSFKMRGLYDKWSSIASSKNGTTLVASVLSHTAHQGSTQKITPGYLYISHDTGASWEKIATNVGNQFWKDVVVSSDGERSWAVVNNGYMYAADANNSNADASCFAATELIQLESGSEITIDKVRVGDRVLAYDVVKGFAYSNVVAVPHGENSVLAEFLLITTASGTDLKLTPKHLIGVSEDCGQSFSSRATASFTLVRAEEVRPGNCLLTVNGVAAVTGIERASGQGLYTIVTEAEYLVVNGIVASPFAVSHNLGSLLYSGHRLMWSTFPGVFSSILFTKSLHFLSEIVMVLSY